MNDSDPFMTFDWYFADISRRDAARYHALEDKQLETSVLMKLINADTLMHFALLMVVFRQASAVLRCWFEIGVHAVFFSEHYGQPSGRYEQWRRGKRTAPANIRDLARSLASRQDMVVKEDEATILKKLEPLYSFLFMQTYAQGLDIYDLQYGRDNVPRYLARSFDIWHRKVLEVFGAFCFLYRAFFPKEIASYLKKSKMDFQRTKRLAELLSDVIPDYGSLMTDVSALVASTSS